MSHTEWVLQIIGDDSQRAASKKMGKAESTLSRQLSRGTISPEMVIALCRAYDRSPVTGLIETGYIEEWETEDVGIPYALKQATNEQILDEIMRRSDPEARELFTNDNNPDMVDIHDDATIHTFPSPTVSPVDETQEDETSDGYTYEDLYEDPWETLGYVADSSPTEPEPGDEDYHDGP